MHGDADKPDGGAQSDRLRDQMAALARFGLEAFRSEDIDELLTHACELVSTGLGVRFSKVLELLPDGAGLLVRAGVNWKPGVVGHAVLGADDNSPAGYAVRSGRPVVSSTLADEHRFRVPPVLAEHGIQSMINVVIEGTDGPFGVLEVDSPVSREFRDDDIRFLQNYANLLAGAIERQHAARELRRAASEQGMLVQELAHRVKNMLGLVQSLAMQTGGKDPAALAYRDVFVGRLQALARAETLLFEDGAQSVELRQLLPRSLEPFGGADERSFTMDGPSVALPARSGRILALVLHELATNASKYGALSSDAGRVRLAWRVEQRADAPQSRPGDAGRVENFPVSALVSDPIAPWPAEAFDGGERDAETAKNPATQGCWLRLRWTEEDGPAVVPPTSLGFGTRLLTTLARYELGGDVQLCMAPAGLDYELVFPVPCNERHER